jgi:hypothetical protein
LSGGKVIRTLGLLLVFVFAIRAFAQSPGQLLADPTSRKGLISDRGQRKQAFYVLQKYYREKETQ